MRLLIVPDRDTQSLPSRPIIDDGFVANINRPWRDRVPRSGMLNLSMTPHRGWRIYRTAIRGPSRSRCFIDDGFFAYINRHWEGPRNAVRDAEPLDDASLRLANIPDRDTRSLQSRRFVGDGFCANPPFPNFSKNDRYIRSDASADNPGGSLQPNTTLKRQSPVSR